MPSSQPPGDRLGTKYFVPERRIFTGIPPAKPTEFEDQFFDQGDSNDPSFEENNKLVDDTQKNNKYGLDEFFQDAWNFSFNFTNFYFHLYFQF